MTKSSVAKPACSQGWICIQVSNQLDGQWWINLYLLRSKYPGSRTATIFWKSRGEVFPFGWWWETLTFFVLMVVVGKPTNLNKRWVFRWTLRGFGVGLSRGKSSEFLVFPCWQMVKFWKKKHLSSNGRKKKQSMGFLAPFVIWGWGELPNVWKTCFFMASLMCFLT